MTLIDPCAALLNSKCCAQTAALDGKKEKRCQRQNRGYCVIIKALCNDVRCSTKGMPKHVPEAFQNPAWNVSKPSKIQAWGGFGRQMCTQDAPQTSQDAPKRAQDAPQSAQEAPKRAQETPKNV